MYYGYCFTADGWHTPKVHLDTPEEAYRYCALHHQLFPEVMITDEGDYCVMHVRQHVLKVPLPQNEFRWIHLSEQRAVRADEQW